MNHVCIKGRLGADPELRYAGNGTAIASFNVATDESYTDSNGERVQKAEWHRVTFFKRPAETIANHFTKGQEILVTGKLQTDKYTDNSGVERYVTKIIGQRFEFCGSRGDNQQQGNNGGGGGYQQGGYQRQQNRQQQNEDLEPAFPPEASGMDDVPF